MFTGFAPLRGAELALIETECFGIDHPTAGALWVDSLGFPQSVADTIRHAAQPPAPADQPLELSLRGACALAVAIANQDAVEAAANALPPSVRGRCTSADGRADAAFVKLYELLRETRPEI
jgi:hypothetical protein